MFRRSRTTLAAAGLLCAALLVGACGQSAQSAQQADSDPSTLVFASIPSEDAQGLSQEWGVVAKVIAAETGKKVDFMNASDYAAVIEAQRAGKVQIASYGPFSYITAQRSGVKLTAVATAVDDPKEGTGYHSLAFAHPGSGITNLAQMRGRSICFVDPTSTSGYLYPSEGLLGVGINPANDVKPTFAGGQDASLLAIKNGQCDAGFASDKMYKVLAAKGELPAGSLTQLWTSSEIANSPVTISDSLSPQLKAKLTTILRTELTIPKLIANGYCTDAANCAMPDGKKYGFVATNDAAFAGVRKVCEITKAKACQ